MNTASNKAKGRRLQDSVARDIERVLGEIPRKAIMGQTGVDVEAIKYGIECTNSESINLWKKLDQCVHNAETIKKMPILVFKKNRSKVYAVVEWEILVSLLALWETNLAKVME